MEILYIHARSALDFEVSSYLCRCSVLMLHRRWCDVAWTSCAYWVVDKNIVTWYQRRQWLALFPHCVPIGFRCCFYFLVGKSSRTCQFLKKKKEEKTASAPMLLSIVFQEWTESWTLLYKKKKLQVIGVYLFVCILPVSLYKLFCTTFTITCTLFLCL